MKTLLPFLILFLIHHFLLAPLIRKRIPIYIGLTLALLALYGVWCFSSASRPNWAPPFPGEAEMMPPPPPVADGKGPGNPGRRGPMSPERDEAIVLYFAKQISYICRKAKVIKK